MPSVGFPYAFPFYIPSPPAANPEVVEGISPIASAVQLLVPKFAQYLKINATTAKTNVQAFVDVICNQVNDIEDAFQQLFFYRMLANAFGQQLDNIGAVVGLPRNGLDDPTYQLYLLAQIAADNSSGTTEDLNTIFELLLSLPATAGVTFAINWWIQAAFVIYLTDPNGVLTAPQIAAFAHFMREARGAAIGGVLEYSIGTPDADLFRFDIGPGLDVGLFRGASN